MCTFINELPKRSKTAESTNPKSNKKINNMMMAFKPTNGNDVYRFRLLNFKSATCNRDFPFIEKYVHEYWKDEVCADGKTRGKLKDFVTCPNTVYMKVNGLDYECPICKYGWAHFSQWKESGKKDPIAKKKWQSGMNKYVAILPVYVVKDPHNPDNNGTLKVIILKNKDMYNNILSLIKEEQKRNCVFNANNAVDFFTTVAENEIIYREGEPTEFRFKRVELDKMGFSKKPYDIPLITKELVDSFQFDDEYYTTTTEEEAQDFLETYIIQPDINTPDDDIDINNKDDVQEKIDASDTLDITNIINERENASADQELDDLNNLDDLNMDFDDDVDIKPTPNDHNIDDTDDLNDINLDDLIEEIEEM